MDNILTGYERNSRYFNRTLPISDIDLGRVNLGLNGFNKAETSVILGYLQVNMDTKKLWLPQKSAIVLDFAKDSFRKYNKDLSEQVQDFELTKGLLDGFGDLIREYDGNSMFLFVLGTTKTFPSQRLFEMILKTQ